MVTPAEDPSDLRAIAEAVDAAAGANQRVGDARRNGRSWGRIGMALGISRQAAQERYGTAAGVP